MTKIVIAKSHTYETKIHFLVVVNFNGKQVRLRCQGLSQLPRDRDTLM